MQLQKPKIHVSSFGDFPGTMNLDGLGLCFSLAGELFSCGDFFFGGGYKWYFYHRGGSSKVSALIKTRTLLHSSLVLVNDSDQGLILL